MFLFYMGIKSYSDTCKFIEPDATQILPSIWLGNSSSSNNFSFLRYHNIKFILRLTDKFDFDPHDPFHIHNKHIVNTSFGFIYRLNNFIYFHFPITDSMMCSRDMFSLFETTNTLLNECLTNTKHNILVHCQRGHHRSATVIAAFIIKFLGASYRSTISFINRKRKCAVRRDTCLMRGLFRYYLNINNIQCPHFKCFKQDTYFICDC